MRKTRVVDIPALILAVWLPVFPALADGASLFPVSGAGTTPLIARSPSGILAEPRGNLLDRRRRPHVGTLGASGTDRALLDIIASAEVGTAGYDAVQHGARIRPNRLPTSLTLGEVFDWIDATPGQHHAIGRYQIIPSTLRDLVEDMALSSDEVFSPDLQDRMALELLMKAGYGGFLEGQIARGKFMDNLARVWAGLPTASGKSHYHGYAGNRATITRSRFEREMARIFHN